MQKLDLYSKENTCAGKAYPWNTAMYSSLVSQSLNGVLGLINQIIYNNNPNPLYRKANVYNDNSSKVYVRAGKNAMSSTMSFGNPFI